MNSESPPPRKLLDQLRDKARLLHLSRRTEDAYADWARRFILFHNKRHPKDMGAAEIEGFLSHLARDRLVAASTQNQAFSALLFLYQKVLQVELPAIDALRARRPKRLPVVLSTDEVRRLLAGLDGIDRLMAELLYGAGLRVLECCRLRVKDIDFDRKTASKSPSAKARATRTVPLPRLVRPDLERRLAERHVVHQRDLAPGEGWISLPDTLEVKYLAAHGRPPAPSRSPHPALRSASGYLMRL